MRISDYFVLSKEERQKHIDLTTKCQLIRMTGTWTKHKKDFINFLNLEDDLPSWRGRVHRCHACKNDTQQSFVCINPLHIYLGPPQENLLDRSPEKARMGGLALTGTKRNESFRLKNRKRLQRPIKVLTISTGEIKSFASQKEAAKELGLCEATVSNYLKIGHPKNGRIFIREDCNIGGYEPSEPVKVDVN